MAKTLKDLAVSDTGFVFDPSTGQTFLLNKTGLRIVKMLLEGIPAEKTSERLEEEFEISRDNALEDVREFISLMNEMGLKVDAA